jgi:hypothetical protein
MLAGLLLYRYFLTPKELRTIETDEQWLDRIVELGERLLTRPDVPNDPSADSGPTPE